jgi:ribonucleoside-triphosphate reductase
MSEYRAAKNAATGSKVDSNANVDRKNIATLANEVPKQDLIGINRLEMCDMLTKLFGAEWADQYLSDLDNHIIYRHDETALVGTPYCVSMTMYPFLFNGLSAVGGTSDAPKHLHSFCGAFINLVFAVAAQFAGAVSTPEFLAYMDYFIRKDYGDDYYLRVGEIVDMSNRRRTLEQVIENCFDQVVYSINQPAAARGNQAVFWNIAYFDKPYFNGMFENFVFPDGTSMQWQSVSWLQKKFMKWFNAERLKKPLTFPVETMNLLAKDGDYVDQDYAHFTAEMLSEGHSFFVYQSDSVDSLASCCRLRNEMQDNTFSYTLGAGGVSTGSKAVITMNINRIVQIARYINEDVSTLVTAVTERIHKYLIAIEHIIRRNYEQSMLPVYDGGFIALEKQYLTVGVNGFIEGAEVLGINVSPFNNEYEEYCNRILQPIYELNKRDRTKQIMFNTEFVPNH